MRIVRFVLARVLPVVPVVVGVTFASASCMGDDPVAGADASPAPTTTGTTPPAADASSPSDAASSDGATAEASADAGPPCAPPRLAGTTSEDVTAGVPSGVDVQDLTFDCNAYYAVTNTGSVLRRGFAETTWQAIVAPGGQKMDWAIQVDDSAIYLAQRNSSSFNGAPGATQIAVEAFRFDKTGANKLTVFSEAPAAPQTAVEFSGPFQRTANAVSFLGTTSNRNVVVVAKRTPASAQVSGGLGFLGKSVTFDEASIVGGGNILAWARPSTPGGPAQVTIEGNARTSTIQTLTDSPRATKATLPGFRAITDDYALFRATNALGLDVLTACALHANGVCSLLDAAPFRGVGDFGITAKSPITSDTKFFAVGVIGPNDTGSAISLCETAAYARDNNCGSAKLVGQATGPAATRIALARNDVLVEYPSATNFRRWVRYPRP